MVGLKLAGVVPIVPVVVTVAVPAAVAGGSTSLSLSLSHYPPISHLHEYI